MIGICIFWLAATSGITDHPRVADKEHKTSSTNGLAANDVTPSLMHCQCIFYNFYYL